MGKRSVNASPTTRLPEKPNGIAPAIQQWRMPFFSNIVVIVPVVTLRRISSADAIATSLGGRLSSGEAEPVIAPAHIGDEGHSDEYHPELADNLPEQEFE